MRMKIKHVRRTDLPLPVYQSDGAAGLDLYADEGFDKVIYPGACLAIGTNVAVEIPEGYEGQIRGRSGLAFKHGVLGHVGTIDSDYRGEIKALLYNTLGSYFVVRQGDRIAQLVIAPVVRVTLEAVGELGDSARGEKGFGSTGVARQCVETSSAQGRCALAAGHSEPHTATPPGGHRIWDANRGEPGDPTQEQIKEWADPDKAHERVFGPGVRR